jgi:siroheme synthase-like protein
MDLLPVFMKLDNRRVLVIGAGAVALEKLSALDGTGANIHVVAESIRPEVTALANAGKISITQRSFTPTDLDNAFFVIAATNNSAVNAEIHRLARERNILCNAVDDPPNCDFYFGSIVRRGDLQIAISTAGKSPALSQRLRKEIDALLPADAGDWLNAIAEIRSEILATLPPGADRKQRLHQLAQRDACPASVCPARIASLSPASLSKDRSSNHDN